MPTPPFLRFTVLALAGLTACGRQPEDSGNAAAAPSASPDLAAELARFLPAPGTHRARAMELVVPADYRRLSERMAASIRADPAWFEEYARRHPNVRGPLPWHQRFGMSAADYQRMIAMAGQASLRGLGPTSLAVTRAPGGGLALAGTGPAAALAGIVLHPRRDDVETPRGRLTRRIAINQNDPAAPTGPWTGVQWSSEGQAPRVTLALGRTARGEGLLYYVAAGTGETVLLFFDPEPGRPR